MIIRKDRIGRNLAFQFQLFITTTADAHGKVTDKISEVEQIINAHVDALKVQLDEYISSIPDKVV